MCGGFIYRIRDSVIYYLAIYNLLFTIRADAINFASNFVWNCSLLSGLSERDEEIMLPYPWRAMVSVRTRA